MPNVHEGLRDCYCKTHILMSDPSAQKSSLEVCDPCKMDNLRKNTAKFKILFWRN